MGSEKLTAFTDSG